MTISSQERIQYLQGEMDALRKQGDDACAGGRHQTGAGYHDNARRMGKELCNLGAHHLYEGICIRCRKRLGV